MRETALRLAGIGEPEQALAVRLAFNAAQQALTATKKQRLVVNVDRNTSKVVEFEDTDHATQLRGAELMIDLFGVKPSRTAQITNTGPTKIVVNFAPAPQLGEIIEQG